MEKFEEVKELHENLQKDYDTFINTSELIRNSEIQITRLKLTLDNMKEKLQKKISTLDQFNSLNKELSHFNKIYD